MVAAQMCILEGGERHDNRCRLGVISGQTIAGQNLAITLSASTIQKVGRFVRQPIQIDPVPNF